MRRVGKAVHKCITHAIVRKLSLLTGEGPRYKVKVDLYLMPLFLYMASTLAGYAPVYIVCSIGFLFALSYILRKYDNGQAKKGRWPF
jgi:hypothetical protein